MKSILIIGLVFASFSSFAQSAGEDRMPSTKMTPMATIAHQDSESTIKTNVVGQKLEPVQVSQEKPDLRSKDQMLMERKRKGPGQISKHKPVDGEK